ncbi:MAG: beta galactosidase jelly roll domain-containing protein, partial [Ignisphaera sp.]
GRVYMECEGDVVAPLKMVVRASGVRALLYFNGQLIGRYADEGPQTEFYIPEPLARRGINEIAVMLHVATNHAYIDSISIEPYYIHRKTSMELS